MWCIFGIIKFWHQIALQFLSCCPFSMEVNTLMLVFKVSRMGVLNITLKHEVYSEAGPSSLSCSTAYKSWLLSVTICTVFNASSFRQSFSTLVAPWNHLGSFKKLLKPGSYPRGSNVIGLGCGLGTGIFKSSPSICNVQPRLKTTMLQEPVHRLFHRY